MKKNNQLAALLLTILSPFWLSGCLPSDSGSESASDSEQEKSPVELEPETTIAGRAADGYLVNARVCLDVNSDGLCGAGEPETFTSTDGYFNFTVTNVNPDWTLLVEAIANETIDQDNGLPVPRAFTLAADAEHSAFVSPISTLVHQAAANESSGTKAERLATAKAKLQSLFNTQIDIGEDYVAAKQGSGDDAAEYEKLHKAAQIITTMVAKASERISREEAATKGVSEREINASILADVYSRLDKINEIAAVSPDGFDPEQAVNENNLLSSAPETVDDVAESATVADRIANAIEADPYEALALEEPLFEVVGHRDPVTKKPAGSVLQHKAHIGVDGKTTLSVSLLGFNGTSWLPQEELPWLTSEMMVWTGNLWRKSSANMADPAKGTFSNGVAEFKYSAKKVDVSGLPLTLVFRSQSALGAIAAAPDSSAVFSDNAHFYLIKVTAPKDIHLVPVHEASGTECDSGALVSKVTFCNVIFGAGSEGPTTQLNQVPYNDVLPGNWIGLMAGQSEYALRLERDTPARGKALIYKSASNETTFATGTYQRASAPFDHYAVSLPQGFTVMNNDFYAGDTTLTVVGGYVRAGVHIGAGKPLYIPKWETRVVMNKQAWEDVQAAVPFGVYTQD